MTWADVEGQLAQTREEGGIGALILRIDEENGGRGVLEFALRKAVDAAKAAIIA